MDDDTVVLGEARIEPPKFDVFSRLAYYFSIGVGLSLLVSFAVYNVVRAIGWVIGGFGASSGGVMDPLHATIEEFAAEGFTDVECLCSRCRMTSLMPITSLPRILMGLTIAQLSERLPCADCGGQLHSVKPSRASPRSKKKGIIIIFLTLAGTLLGYLHDWVWVVLAVLIGYVVTFIDDEGETWT